jgi:phosphoglycerate dehydrogenase-like enzyme
MKSAEHILYLCLSLMRDQHEMNYSLKKQIVGCPTGRTISGSKFLIYGYGKCE